jgi:FXSXX-COOH protein
MLEKNSQTVEVFNSDIVDLSGIDLSEVSRLSSAILRVSVERVCRELADPGEVAAYFQSSLRTDGED